MRYVLVVLFLAGLLGGCAELDKPGEKPGEVETGALPQEVQALYAQKRIDPLTDYLDKYAKDAERAPYLEQVRKERDKRCAAIAKRYTKRARTQANLDKLEKGYRHSCPAAVDAFAGQVAKAAKGDLPVTPEGGEEAAPADEVEAEAPVEKPAEKAAEKQPVDPKLLENCYLLFTIKNYHEALEACKQPAELGDAKAQYDLAVILRVFQMYQESVNWTRRAVAQGLPEAQYHLGLLYYRGQGLTRDYAEARSWFQQAAERGLAEAQYSVGLMHYQGEGGARNYGEARKWFTLAAEQGNADAQMYLGSIYANGEGVQADGAAAKKWFLKAAEQGVAEAQYNLGAMYANGRGIPKDYVEAYVWFSLAIVGGDRKGLVPRDMVTQQLSAEQLAEAQQRVRRLLERKR